MTSNGGYTMTGIGGWLCRRGVHRRPPVNQRTIDNDPFVDGHFFYQCRRCGVSIIESRGPIA